jgi:replicative DNA helicase
MRLLQGLLDTDGGMANGSSIVDYCTGSKKLAQDVCTLVRSLGGVVREGHKYLKYTYRDKTSILTYYRLYIRFFNGEIPVTSLKHTRKWRVSNRVHTRKVVSIDFVGSKECQCIKIDNSSHLYITDDFIPTHNTAFAVNLARHAVNTGPVLFFSLEQTKEQIFERLLAREAQVPLEDIRSGTYLANPSMVADIAGANKSLEKVMETFHVDDRPNVSTSYITSLGRQMLYEWGKVGLIVVDYLHLMKLPTGNKVDTLGDACKELRGLGKELGCPVIVLSQLSRGPSNERGERTNKRPGMADLRASGEIEQSADIIMFLHRESYGEAFGGVEEDIAEVIVAKNRNGRLGLVEVKWVPRYMLFSDL